MVRTILTALCGLSLVLGLFIQQDWIAYLGIAFGGYFALASAYETLRAREMDVNILMVFAAIGAVIVGRPLDAAALLFLFSLSGTLEHYTMSRTRSAIEGLIRLRPSSAIRVASDREETVPVEELAVGDLIRVPPHSAVAADGVVESGTSEVDQSAMTGESVPVAKREGDLVIAGTMNQSGLLTVRVTNHVADSTLAKIVNLVEDAQENKASGEVISTWFGERYTWFVIGAFAVSLVVRLALGTPWATAFYSSLILLVALSPCALVISTPATTLSALAYAARRGMLIRGGRFVELAGQVKAVLMDKTGTLTTGKPELVEICICHNATVPGSNEGHSMCWHKGQSLDGLALSILRVSASLEQYSAHPIAEAIVGKARSIKIDLPELTGAEALPGLGIRAEVDGKPASIGQLRLYEHLGIRVPQDFLDHLTDMAQGGMSVALVMHGDEFAALGLRDGTRSNASQAIQAMRTLGVERVEMATGDNQETAAAVAKEVGVDKVQAGLLPAQKEQRIAEMEKEFGSAMMVGDGINDAPSLAKASLGVAMGGLGSDIALNAADVVLMHDDLNRIPELIALGRKTAKVVRANLLFASGVILVLTVASFVIKLPLPIAVLGHEGSTVLVILNGLRLLRGPGLNLQTQAATAAS